MSRIIKPHPEIVKQGEVREERSRVWARETAKNDRPPAPWGSESVWAGIFFATHATP